MRRLKLVAGIAQLLTAGALFAAPGSPSNRPAPALLSNYRHTLDLDSAGVGADWLVRATPPADLTDSLFPEDGWHPFRVPSYASDYAELASEIKDQALPELWLRREILLPAGPAPQLSIHLSRINDRDRVYWNGTLIGQSGAWGARVASAYDRERTYAIPESLVRGGQINTLLVHIQGYNAAYVGFDQGGLQFGPTELIYQASQRRLLLVISFAVAYFVVGLYFLFLFVRRRQERENFLFALFCFTVVVFQLLKEQIKYQSGLSFLSLKRAEFVCLYTLGPLFYLFLRSYFDLRVWQFRRWLDGGAIAGSLLCAAALGYTLLNDDPDAWWKVQSVLIVPVAWPLLNIAMASILVFKAVRGDSDARLMLGGFIALFVGVLTDQLISFGVLAMRPIFGYLFSAFIFMVAIILSNRFLRLHREVEDLNQNLEKKVADRTRQLQETLSEVNSLKVQQDGDYFLTSLLLQPLGENTAIDPRVRVEFLVRQKKRFRFRHWQAEIGGDLCAAHDISLGGQRYTAAINADAMGKSIQGAGGALVLGTAFKSMIMRTQHHADYQRKSPERWLMDCLLELQDIFVSFDGRMLVSAFLSLTEQRSGAFYYINAEHPRPALLRKGVVEYLGLESQLLRKLGVEHADLAPMVATFALEPDDILIMGSDGRDDLHIANDEQGRRIINEDMDLFRQIVAEAGGDLRGIHDGLVRRGILTDDLTLLRLSYCEDWSAASRTTFDDSWTKAIAEARRLWQLRDFAAAAEALQSARKSGLDLPREALLIAADCALRLRQGKEALQHAMAALQMQPADSDALYRASQAARLAGDFQLAVELGERLRLRRPLDGAALALLADSCRRCGDSRRASSLLERALQIAPEHQAVQQIQRSFQAR
ncbi:MAG: SpoIIE family protein phosphatase [Leptospirales bacterium]|nr:SpoIIE family protein phosphatase [Leptospirales bacterium]